MEPTFSAPMLEKLNFEQLTWLVNGVSPDVFYREANAFERGANHLRDVTDRFRRELRHVEEVASGEAFDRTLESSERVVAKNEQVLQAMLAPGYAAALRKAGDSLAEAQRRMRDLQMQRDQQPGAPGQQPAFPPQPDAAPAPGADKPEAHRARQIVHDLSAAYVEVGTAMTPLPGTGPGSANPGMAPMSTDQSATGGNTESAAMRQATFASSDVGDAAAPGPQSAPTEAAVLGRPAAVPGRVANTGGEVVEGFAASEGAVVGGGVAPWLPLAATAGPSVVGQRPKRTRERVAWYAETVESEQEGQPAVLGRSSTTPEPPALVDDGNGDTVQPDENRPVTESSDVPRDRLQSDVDGRDEPSEVSEYRTVTGPESAPGHASPQEPHSAPLPLSAESAPPPEDGLGERKMALTATTSSGPGSTTNAPSSALDLAPPSGPSTSPSAPPSGTSSSGMQMGGGTGPEGASTARTGPEQQAGMPMSPMMMGAGMAAAQSQGDREVTTPLGADPDSWKESSALSGSLGRRAPEPAEQEPAAKQTSEERVDEILQDLRERRKIR